MLQRLDLYDARHGLDGTGNLRGDLEAARQFDLNFGSLLQQQDDANLAVTIWFHRSRGSFETLYHRIEWLLIAQKHA